MSVSDWFKPKSPLAVDVDLHLLRWEPWVQERAGAAVGVRFACTRPGKSGEPEMRDAE